MKKDCRLWLLISEGEKLESKMKKLEQQYAPFQVVSLISKLGTKEVWN